MGEKRYRARADDELSQLFNPENWEELTDSLMAELAESGKWTMAELIKWRAEGFYYCRARGSLVEGGFSSFDVEGD